MKKTLQTKTAAHKPVVLSPAELEETESARAATMQDAFDVGALARAAVAMLSGIEGEFDDGGRTRAYREVLAACRNAVDAALTLQSRAADIEGRLRSCAK